MSREPTAMAAPVAERASGRHSLGRSDATAERDADRFADSVGPAGRRFAEWSYRAVPPSSSDQGEPGSGPLVDVALPGPGRPLDVGLQSELGRRLGADLAGVRIHDDEQAADTTRRAGAEALAVGADIAFAPGRYEPHSPAGRRRVAHEVAHVAQHNPSGRPVVRRNGNGPPAPATTLAGLSDADRQRIQVVTTTRIEVTGIDPKFSTAGGTTTLGLPANTTVVLDPSVDAKLTHGLQNVAAALTTTVDVSPAPMADNSTATLELDLTKYGGIKGLYRFTFHAPPAVGKAVAAKRILVEQLGAGAPPAGTRAPAAPAPGGTPAPDPVAAKITKNGIVQSYAGAELDALRAAISEIPDSHLAIVAGLRFARQSKHPTKPEVAGDYDPKTHTVTMYDRAFASTQVKLEQGRRATSFASRAIVHEIGHAIDLDPLRQATRAKDTADRGVADLPKNFPDPADPSGYRYDNPSDKKKIADILAAQKAAEAKLLKSRSRSGTTTRKNAVGDIEDVIGAGTAGIGYRTAAAKDGIAVSKYAETDWQENYAEAYSLYIIAPDTLKALRPATFDYLDQNLPK